MDNGPPPHGISTKVKIIRVIDGDTVEVEISRRFQVRLQHPNDNNLIYDTPEKDTVKGQEIKEIISQHCNNESGTLFVPSGQDLNLFDTTTFGRVVGALWVKGKRLTSIGIEKGLGRLIKASERTKTPWPWEK